MLHNLSYCETRFRPLCSWYLLHSSFNLAFRQCKLHNIFSEWRISKLNVSWVIFIYNLPAEWMHSQKSQVDLSSKYDREHNFDVILGQVVPCREVSWICPMHSNNVALQVEIPSKATIFIACHNFHVAFEVTLYRLSQKSTQLCTGVVQLWNRIYE